MSGKLQVRQHAEMRAQKLYSDNAIRQARWLQRESLIRYGCGIDALALQNEDAVRVLSEEWKRWHA